MTTTKKAETVQGARTVSAAVPTLNVDELTMLMHSVAVDSIRRAKVADTVAAFLAAADAANAMASAATSAAEAVRSLAAVGSSGNGTNEDDVPDLVTPSPDSIYHEDLKNIDVAAAVATGGIDGPPVAPDSDKPLAKSAGDFPEPAAPPPASGASTGPWYTITVGRQVGVYPHWSIVSPLVLGVSNACFAKHATEAAARSVFRMAINAGAVRIVPDLNDVLVNEDDGED